MTRPPPVAARRSTCIASAASCERDATVRAVAIDFTHVRAEGLVKMYGPTRALAGVDLELTAGVVTVIEGPNGAGKSTLLDILSLLSRPTRGTVRFGAHDAWHERQQLRRTLGVLAHAAMLYPDLTGRENLALFARMYGVPPARVSQLGERFEATGFWERPTRTYSRGQLQRLALARALLHEPRLILLDEPSTGLDVRSTERLIEAVAVERARGAIVVLITHDPQLVERIADRRVRLARGRVEEQAA
jgi:ABC-type multidrug transport system ATPase subunit